MVRDKNMWAIHYLFETYTSEAKSSERLKEVLDFFLKDPMTVALLTSAMPPNQGHSVHSARQFAATVPLVLL